MPSDESPLECVLQELSKISERLGRMDEKLDIVVTRSGEDRARISINTENITALRIGQATIADRQRGLAALSGVLATIVSTAAAVTVSIFGVKS